MKSKTVTLIAGLLCYLSLLHGLIAQPLLQKSDSIQNKLLAIEDINSRFDRCLRMAKAEQNLEDKLAILKTLDYRDHELRDTVLANHLYYLSEINLRLNNRDSALFYNDLVYQLADQHDLYVFQLRALNVTAHFNAISGYLDSAIVYYKQALDIIGEMYENESDTLKKIKLYEADVLGNLSGIFFNIKDYESARKYVLRSEEICNEYDLHESSAYNLIRLAMIYSNQGDPDQALTYNLRSVEKLKLVKDSSLLVYTYLNIGRNYFNKEDLSKALLYFSKAEKLTEKIDADRFYQDIYNEKIKVYVAQGKTGLAEKTGNQLLDHTLSSGNPQQTGNAYNRLHEIALAKKDFKKALDYRNRYFATKDSIAGVEVQNKIAELQTQYETAQKEAAIKELSLRNEIQSALLAKSQLVQIGSAVVFVLILSFLIIFFRQRVKKREAEKEAQALQLEALQKRFIELHSSPAEIAVALEMNELNDKLYTPLTEREFDVLRLSISGKTNVQIGEELFISVSTVKFHLRNTYSKMGVKNRKEAFQRVLKTS